MKNENFIQIAANLRASGIRSDWCDKIEAAQELFELTERYKSIIEDLDFPACLPARDARNLLERIKKI